MVKIFQSSRRIFGASLILGAALVPAIAWANSKPQPDAACSPQALQSLEKRAKKGEAAAQLKLGRDYFVGKCMPQNPKFAVQWLRKAVEQQAQKQQHVDGMSIFSIGVLYLTGRGVPQSIVVGYALITLSAGSLESLDVSPKPSDIQAELEKNLTAPQLHEGQQLMKEIEQGNSITGPIDRYLAKASGSH